MTPTTPSLFLLLAVVWAVSAQATTTGSTVPAFSVHDLDQDGSLDRAEYAALQARCKDRLDSRGRPRCALIDFNTLDHDRDGRVSEEELLRTLSRQGHGARQGWRGLDCNGQPDPRAAPSK